jgi:hypothetical protein
MFYYTDLRPKITQGLENLPNLKVSQINSFSLNFEIPQMLNHTQISPMFSEKNFDCRKMPRILKGVVKTGKAFTRKLITFYSFITIL